MTRSGALPKYLAIAEGLARDIGAGRYAVGARLPGEREMADQLGIAVGTLRKALAELETRKMLKRVQGSGNYVAKTADDTAVYAFFRLEKPTGGGLPTAQVLNVHFDNHWHIKRIRFLDGCKVALEHIELFVCAEKNLDQLDLSDSLYLTYREHLGVLIASVEDQVTVGAWPDWGPFPADTPCGLVKRKAYDRTGNLAETSTTWFAPDRAIYTSRFK